MDIEGVDGLVEIEGHLQIFVRELSPGPPRPRRRQLEWRIGPVSEQNARSQPVTTQLELTDSQQADVAAHGVDAAGQAIADALSIAYSSADPAIVEASDHGDGSATLIARGVGSATVTASASDSATGASASADIEVTISAGPLAGLTFDIGAPTEQAPAAPADAAAADAAATDAAAADVTAEAPAA